MLRVYDLILYPVFHYTRTFMNKNAWLSPCIV